MNRYTEEAGRLENEVEVGARENPKPTGAASEEERGSVGVTAAVSPATEVEVDPGDAAVLRVTL